MKKLVLFIEILKPLSVHMKRVTLFKDQFSLRKILEILPTTVGSRSINTALGTCLPAPVSLKNVLKESSPPPMVLSDGI